MPRTVPHLAKSASQLSPAQRELVRVCKALADEQRLRILVLLAQFGERSVSAISEVLGQSQPAISHHLNQLKASRLIEFRRDGKFNYYTLSETGLESLAQELGNHLSPLRVQVGGIEITVKWKPL